MQTLAELNYSTFIAANGIQISFHEFPARYKNAKLIKIKDFVSCIYATQTGHFLPFMRKHPPDYYF